MERLGGEWHVSIRVSYGNNCFGLYGDRDARLNQAIGLTAARVAGYQGDES
jgi:hypothetical protein